MRGISTECLVARLAEFLLLVPIDHRVREAAVPDPRVLVCALPQHIQRRYSADDLGRLKGLEQCADLRRARDQEVTCLFCKRAFLRGFYCTLCRPQVDLCHECAEKGAWCYDEDRGYCQPETEGVQSDQGDAR